MEGYIEVTDKNKGFKILLASKLIKSVLEAKDGTAVIEMVEVRNGFEDIIFCRESYYSVLQLLSTCKGQMFSC